MRIFARDLYPLIIDFYTILLNYEKIKLSDGEHDTDGQAVADLGLADKEVPEVAFVIVSCGYGLGRIDDRTATHSEHKVGFETAGKCQSFVNLGVGGIGADATHFDIGDGNGIERGLDTIEQATANHRAASEEAPLGEYQALTPDSTEARVVCLPTRHFSGRGLKSNQSLWASFMLETPSLRVFVGGDGGYDGRFKRIGERFPVIDLAIPFA